MREHIAEATAKGAKALIDPARFPADTGDVRLDGASYAPAGPRDAKGQSGPYEAALKGHKLYDPKQPVEILRTIHSFDPCIACAVHVTDPEGEELVKVKVV